jgi:hypothetical protein
MVDIVGGISTNSLGLFSALLFGGLYFVTDWTWHWTNTSLYLELNF